MDNNFYDELEQWEYKLKDFMKENARLEQDVEYIVYNECGDDYRISFNPESEEYNIYYFESKYTKFWGFNVHAQKYLELKEEYLKNNLKNVSIELDVQDECNPALVFSMNCDENQVKETIQSIEKIFDKFTDKFNDLEKEVDNVISNFKFN